MSENNDNNNDDKSLIEKAKDVFSTPVEQTLEPIKKAKVVEEFKAPPVTAMFVCPDTGGRVFISEEKIKCFNIKGDKTFKAYKALSDGEREAKLKEFRKSK